MYSLQLKIFALVAGLLLLIQGISLFAMYQRLHTDAVNGLTARVQQGLTIFLDQLDLRTHGLDVYAATLAKDFGLLAAFHEGHQSLLDALRSRQQRVGADLAVAVNLHGQILAQTATPELRSQPFLLTDTGRPPDGKDLAFLEDGGNLYQVVGAPVNAPARVGWIYLGFRVNDALADSLAGIVSLQVTFLQRDANGHWQVIASSLTTQARADLNHQFSLSNAPLTNRVLQLDGETFVGMPTNLIQASTVPVAVLLQISETAAMESYYTWWRQVTGILIAALLLALVGAWLLARHIARPIRILVGQASAIAAGNVPQPIVLQQRGELGALVSEFSRMQAAVVERELSLRYQAEHDPITGLANRFSLEKHLEKEIRKLDGVSQRLAVLIVNLDRF